MRCPNCKSLNIIKRGRRKIKFGSKQLYQCKDCRLRFSDSRIASKTYQAKVIIKAINCYNLGQYIKRFEQDGCPDFFESIPYRCSQTAVKAWVRKKNWRNNACSLAELALLPCTNNRQRHPLVQEFMLINDSSSIAVELPVWLYERGLRKRMSGHIDVLQVRGGKIYVLDYKPNAETQNEDKVVSQLYWYATGLSFRSRLPLRFFRCAWFDDNIYFEFDPNAVRVAK